jgi:hypothetical protein
MFLIRQSSFGDIFSTSRSSKPVSLKNYQSLIEFLCCSLTSFQSHNPHSYLFFRFHLI